MFISLPLFIIIACKVNIPMHQGTGKDMDVTTEPEGYDSWDISKLNTAIDADYISKVEKEVILEINLLRSDPPKYAELYLKPYLQYYHGLDLNIPGEITIVTDEGIKPLEECISQLGHTKPVPIFYPAKGMCRSSHDHAIDQGKTGQIGHSGSDGSTMTDRINRYGKWSFQIGENVDYGNAIARRIVISLLIDDGVSSRGHRKNLLNDAFHKIGVAVGPHPKYGYLCVMDFAGGYE
jgi:hypothetical protein